MSRLLAIAKDPRFAVMLFAGAIAPPLFFLGPRIGITGLTRALSVVAILVLALIIVLVLWVRRSRKRSDDLEESLLIEADTAVGAAPRDQKAASEAARREFSDAITALKKSRLAGGRSGRTALHLLPWYLVLGRHGSGKSTMIRNSGLKIPGERPRDPRGQRGVGPGTACSWWFTNSAILLETADRFAEIDDDPGVIQDWQGLLDVLRKSRRGTPANGIVVALSMEDLIRQDSSRLEEHARALRQRLDACAENLRIHCPVYLVVTKTDLVHGFAEFFEDLEGNAKDQFFGATIPQQHMASPHPQRVFTREYEGLFRSLCKRRIPRMAGEEDVDRRGRVYLFPMEFASLRRKLRRFVKTVFEPNPYEKTPAPSFRGFYFTSGAAEGRPVEMVVNEMSRVMGLPPDLSDRDESEATRFYADPADGETASPSPSRSSNGQPMFLRELFTRVLLGDADLARPTRKAVRTRAVRDLIVRYGGLAFVGLMALGLVVSFTQNRSALLAVRDVAEEARLIRASSEPAGVEKNLRSLDGLLAQLKKLDWTDEHRPFTKGFGLYRGTRVNEEARRRVYFPKFEELLLVPSRARLESDLRQGMWPETAENFKEAFFPKYRTYRTILEPDVPDTVYVPELQEQLTLVWSSGRRATSSETLSEVIHPHVEYAFRHRGELYDPLLEQAGADQLVMRLADGYIDTFWLPDPYYEAMISAVNKEVPAFSRSTVSNGAVALRFSPPDSETAAQDSVPGAFTASACRDHIGPEITRSEKEIRGDWLLKRVLENKAPGWWREQLSKLYSKQYREEWVAFLNGVDVTAWHNVRRAAEDLDDLVDEGPSAMLYLLKDASAELDFQDLFESEDPMFEETNQLEHDFQALHSLFERPLEDDESRPIDEIVEWWKKMVADLQVLAEAEESGYACWEKATEVFASRRGVATGLIPESIRYVHGYCRDSRGNPACNEALETLLNRPVEAAWGAILHDAERYLDENWRARVHREFSDRLGGRYPVTNVGTDALRGDFETFFSPEGTFASFYQEALMPFIDHGGSTETVYNRRLHISPDAANAIAKAHAIQSAMFPEGRLGFAFEATPSTTNRGWVATTHLRVGREELDYPMGNPDRYRRTFQWAGDDGASVSVTAPGRRAPSALNESGPWALFKILDRASVDQRSGGGYRVKWELRGGDDSVDVPYTLIPARSVNALRPGFLRFACPSQISG